MMFSEQSALKRLCRDPQIGEIVDGICNHLKWIAIRGAERRVKALIEAAHNGGRVESSLVDREQPLDQCDRESFDTENSEESETTTEISDDEDTFTSVEDVVTPLIPTVALYDPARAEKQLQEALPQSDNPLEEILRQMAIAGSEQRELSIPPDGATAACRRLIGEFPNLSAATIPIAGAVYLAERNQQPVQLPRLLLDGQPGCGKTELIRKVADILNLPLIVITMSALHGQFELVGCNRSYKGAEHGLLVKALLSSRVGNPIFLFDEAELAHPIFYGPLLSFLEDQWFTDVFLSMPFRTQFVNKIFITNNAKRLLPAIRSRMMFAPAQQPTPEEMRSLVRQVYKNLLKSKKHFSDFSEQLSPEVVEDLLQESLRGVRTRLESALYRAAHRSPDAANLSIDPKDLRPIDASKHYVFPEKRV